MANNLFVGFESLVEISPEVVSPTGAFSMPGDTATYLEVVPGRFFGSAVRGKRGFAWNPLDIAMEVQQATWFQPNTQTTWRFEFDFKKELQLDSAPGTPSALNGQNLLRLFDVAWGFGLAMVVDSALDPASPTSNANSFKLQPIRNQNLVENTFQPLGVSQPDAGRLYVNEWYHVKCWGTIDNAPNGSLTLEIYDRRNERIVNYQLTGVDTSGLQSGASGFDNFRFYFHPGITYDNLIVGQDSAKNNGIHHIASLRPRANGNQNQWVPSSGGSNNFEMVDDVDGDNSGLLDSNSVATDTPTAIDLYAFDTLGGLFPGIATGGTTSILGVQLRSWHSEPSPGVPSYGHLYRFGGVNYSWSFSEFNLFGTNPSVAFLRDLSPQDSSAFNYLDVDTAEFGVVFDPA